MSRKDFFLKSFLFLSIITLPFNAALTGMALYDAPNHRTGLILILYNIIILLETFSLFVIGELIIWAVLASGLTIPVFIIRKYFYPKSTTESPFLSFICSAMFFLETLAVASPTYVFEKWIFDSEHFLYPVFLLVAYYFICRFLVLIPNWVFYSTYSIGLLLSMLLLLNIIRFPF